MAFETYELLAEEALTIHFQPIVSLRQKAVVGLEALARPRQESGPWSVPDLFRAARERGGDLELDRLLRRMAMEAYRATEFPGGVRPLLFVNFESSLLDRGVAGSGHILKAVEATGLDPGDVAIEINESEVVDAGALRAFVDFYRSRGFLIALDDLGAGHSNLPRVAALRPDVLKVDRALIQGIDRDFYKQETFRSLVNLGAWTGCQVLAEGVETEAETEACAMLGAALFQGFHFARPQAPESLDMAPLRERLDRAGLSVRAAAARAIQVRRRVADSLRRVGERARDLVERSDATGFDIVLERLVRGEAAIECAYVLNRDGIQVTEAHLGSGLGPARSRLFAPPARGSDHGSREHFSSLLDAGLERYITDVYLSLATGKPCRTVAVRVKRRDGDLVVCLDFRVDL